MTVGTTAGLRAYAQARGIESPGLDFEQLAGPALVRANDYIDTNYLRRFYTGAATTGTDVEAAVYEAALLELDEPGFFNRTFTPGERVVLTEVKGIKFTIVPGGNGASPISTRIEALMMPYMRTYGVAVMVV